MRIGSGTGSRPWCCGGIVDEGCEDMAFLLDCSEEDLVEMCDEVGPAMAAAGSALVCAESEPCAALEDALRNPRTSATW